MKQSIIILGMHRSGTSLISGLISILGAYPGDNLMKPTEDNPKGYYENNSVYLLNKRILDENNTNWDNYSFSCEDIKPDKFIGYIGNAKKVIQEQLKYAKTIVIKDPRICILFPIWEKALKELNIKIKIVLVYRSPLEVAHSLKLRDDMALEKGMMLWSHHFFKSEFYSRTYQRLPVEYNADFYDFDSFLTKLADFIGVDINDNLVSEASRFYSPSLKHQKLNFDNINDDIPTYLRNLILLIRNRDFSNTTRLNELRNDFYFSKDYYLYNKKSIDELLVLKDEKINQQESLLQKKDKKIQQQQEVLDTRYKRVQRQVLELNSKDEKITDLMVDIKEGKVDIEEKKADIEEKKAEIDLSRLMLEANSEELDLVVNTLDLKNKIFNENNKKLGDLVQQVVARDKELNNEIKLKEKIIYQKNKEKDLLALRLDSSKLLFNKISSNKKHYKKFKDFSNGSVFFKMKFAFIFLLKSKKLIREKNILLKSDLFSTYYYFSRYPDIWHANVDPIEHYCCYGWKEGRNPSEFFDTNAYLNDNPDVVNVGINPLIHYIRYGQAEGRQVSVIHTDIQNNEIIKKKSIVKSRIKTYRGEKTTSLDNPTLLLVSHNVSATVYGGERSFLDMLKAASDADVNVVVALPREQLDTIEQMKPYVISLVVFSYGWWKKNNPISSNAIADFSTVIKTYNISFVHVNTIMLREALIAAKQLELPSIIHIRELITGDQTLAKIIGKKTTKIIEQVNQASDYIIANSRETAKAYNGLDKITIIHNTVDIAEFDIENTIGSTLRVALVSSNIEKKGVFEFLQIAELCRDIENVEFILVGPETQEVKDIQQQMQRTGLVNLQIAGYRESATAAMAEANIILNISKFTESFGRTVLEGMAARRPVIAYRWGAVSELIINNETGYLVPYLDINAVATKIKYLNSHREILLEMGNKGRVHADKVFGFSSYADKVKTFYSKILTEKCSNTLHRRESSQQRIAYFLWHFPVPSETFVLNELRVLVAEGYDVIVYCKQSPFPDFSPDFEITWDRVSSPKELAKKLLKSKRTIVHSHFTFPTVTNMVWPACEIAKINFTFIAHAQDIFRYENIKKNRIGEISHSAYCKKVLIPSRYHRDYVIEQGVIAEKTFINPNGIDPKLYEENRALTEIKALNFSICAIHRYTEKKGLDNLILSFPYLNNSNIEIHIHGYGELEEAYKNLVEQHKLSNVHIHGAVKSRQEMLEVFSNNDAFLCPSVRAKDGDMDGIPTVLMEAMAYGIPVISTRLSGIPDMIDHKLTGFITEATPEGVAKTINELYSMPRQQVVVISKAAKDVIYKKYNAVKLVNSLVRTWSDNNSLDIIIVSWNNLPELQEVIRRIQQYTLLHYNLIICDNNSEKKVKDYLLNLEKNHDNVKVYLNPDNVMVGPGSNIAIEMGTAEYIIYVCGKEGFTFDYQWESTFIDYMDENQKVGLGGTLCYSPSYLTGKSYPSGVALFDKFRNKHFATENPERIFKHVQGGFFIIRRKMYEQIGGFSEAVKHQYTDVEYSYYAESCGWELGSINGMISLYNKSRPTLFSRFDESLKAIHPPTLEQLPLLDKVVNNKIKFCNVCEWSGDVFKKNEACPSCTSLPDDRSLFRYLAESTLTYRRLPALSVELSYCLHKFWSNQFQGELLTYKKVAKMLSKTKQLKYSSNKMQVFYYKNNQTDLDKLILAEAARVLKKGQGLLLLQQSSSQQEGGLSLASVINTLSKYNFKFEEEVSYSSSVIQYGWNRFWIFKLATINKNE
jgi:glycosyltransferase involved in cell wall biosynthesis